MLLIEFKIKKIFFSSFFLLFFSVYAQYSSIEKMRLKYCKKDCGKYKKDLLLITKNKIYPIYNDKFHKRFSIPKIERLKLYPFNQYDSIYIANPIFIKDISEPRDYLNSKYHNFIRLLSKKEFEILSNIMFNYANRNVFVKTGLNEEISCDCIQFEYPKIILLFKKNGRFEKFIAFPDNGLNRYNFSNEEWDYFDWSIEKEDMILEMFKKDILPNQNCKIEVYIPPPPPKNKK